MKDNRDKVVAAAPEGTKPKEIMSLMGNKWKELSDSAKQPYEKRAEKLRSDYVAAKAAYAAGDSKAPASDKDAGSDSDEESDDGGLAGLVAKGARHRAASDSSAASASSEERPQKKHKAAKSAKKHKKKHKKHSH
jgi:hypothetical protein